MHTFHSSRMETTLRTNWTHTTLKVSATLHRRCHVGGKIEMLINSSELLVSMVLSSMFGYTFRPCHVVHVDAAAAAGGGGGRRRQRRGDYLSMSCVECVEC